MTYTCCECVYFAEDKRTQSGGLCHLNPPATIWDIKCARPTSVRPFVRAGDIACCSFDDGWREDEGDADDDYQ